MSDSETRKLAALRMKTDRELYGILERDVDRWLARLQTSGAEGKREKIECAHALALRLFRTIAAVNPEEKRRLQAAIDELGRQLDISQMEAFAAYRMSA